MESTGFLHSLTYDKRERIALYVALAFHVFGCIGILNNIAFFVNNTALNLWVCFALILFTHRTYNKFFTIFVFFAFGLGMVVEVIGVNTGMLFGNYKYGAVMGIGIKGVPITIGLNWFVTLYCCCVAFASFQRKALKNMEALGRTPPHKYLNISFIADTAGMAVLFDWIMEPIATKLGFWQWFPNNEIPSYNYVCWFIFSLPIALFFKGCKVDDNNKFAIHLLMIQAMFFLILRTFL
jgi:bisanhydrobacterioruberin hydratase